VNASIATNFDESDLGEFMEEDISLKP